MPPPVEGDLEGPEEATPSVLLEQIEQGPHIPSPGAGPTVDELGEERLSDRSEFEQPLANK